ncbi:MAG: cupin domain-containing protein [Patescibacteria group bacterium]|jgi:hypothetical protein
MFVLDIPSLVSFSREGVDGFSFGVQSQNIEIDYIDSKSGHGGKVVSDILWHYYYILDGSGEFIIDDETFPVSQGQLIEIPPKHTFDYRGRIKMLLIMNPPFSPEKIKEIGS